MGYGTDVVNAFLCITFIADEEVLAYNAQQSKLDDILGDLW